MCHETEVIAICYGHGTGAHFVKPVAEFLQSGGHLLDAHV